MLISPLHDLPGASVGGQTKTNVPRQRERERVIDPTPFPDSLRSLWALLVLLLLAVAAAGVRGGTGECLCVEGEKQSTARARGAAGSNFLFRSIRTPLAAEKKLEERSEDRAL